MAKGKTTQHLPVTIQIPHDLHEQIKALVLATELPTGRATVKAVVADLLRRALRARGGT